MTLNQVRDAWSDVLSKVNKQSKSAWMVAFSLTVVDFADEILTLKFLSQNDLDAFKNASGASDILRKAIVDVLGVQVKFKAQIEAPAPAAPVAPPVVAAPKTSRIAVVHTPAPDDEEPEPEYDEPAVQVEAPKPPAVEEAPAAELEAEATAVAPKEAAKPEAAPAKSRNGMVDESARYGESLLREMLGAEPIVDKNAGK